jgi:hypothetical protein
LEVRYFHLKNIKHYPNRLPSSFVSTSGGYVWSDRMSLWSPSSLPILVDTRLKVDSSGWAIEWQKFSNTGASPITLSISNGFADKIFAVRGFN